MDNYVLASMGSNRTFMELKSLLIAFVKAPVWF